MADAGVHPSYLGSVIACFRTLPIRVGHLMNGLTDECKGKSGSFFIDSTEITWGMLMVEPELTTNTKRVRRVATFSEIQYQEALDKLRPDFVFMNFMNYLSEVDQMTFLSKHPEITHVGYGPETIDVLDIRKCPGK